MANVGDVFCGYWCPNSEQWYKPEKVLELEIEPNIVFEIDGFLCDELYPTLVHRWYTPSYEPDNKIDSFWLEHLLGRRCLWEASTEERAKYCKRVEKKTKKPTVCTCDIMSLMRVGCVCGGG